MNKKIILIAALVILLGASFWFMLTQERVKAYEFVGDVEKIEGSEILMEGLFVVEGRPDLASDKNRNQATVVLNQDTKYMKEVIMLPKPSDLESPDATFKVDDLKKETIQVTLEQLRQDLELEPVGVRVKSDKNIYGKRKFQASEIFYKAAVLPLDQQ
jgi:hypothetical protein